MTQSTAHHLLPREGQVTPFPAQPPAWQQTNPAEKQRIFFFSVLESWSGWWESPVDVRASWREQTDWRKRDCSFSIFWWDQFIASTAPAALLESPFSLSLDCGKSPGKQIFPVSALPNTPLIAHTRIYDSLTKQITRPIKANPWNLGSLNFHSSTTSSWL